MARETVRLAAGGTASVALLLGLSQILHVTFAVIPLIHVLEAAPGA